MVGRGIPARRNERGSERGISIRRLALAVALDLVRIICSKKSVNEFALLIRQASGLRKRRAIITSGAGETEKLQSLFFVPRSLLKNCNNSKRCSPTPVNLPRVRFVHIPCHASTQ